MIPILIRNSWLMLAFLSVALNFKSCLSQPSPQSQLSTPTAFMEEALNLVNQLRAKHQSGPLQLNLSLSTESEIWAKKIGAESDKISKAKAYYSRAPGVGETVWVTDSFPDINASVPLMAWYDQVQKHNWSNNIFNYDTAQFTTLIWKASTQFGIAKFKTPVKGYIMVVARYIPPGNSNYYSSFAANVLPQLVNSTTTTASTTPSSTPPTTKSSTPPTTAPGKQTTAPGTGATTPNTGSTVTTAKPSAALTTPKPSNSGTFMTPGTAITTQRPGSAVTFSMLGRGGAPTRPGASSTTIPVPPKAVPFKSGDEGEIVFIPEDINQSING